MRLQLFRSAAIIGVISGLLVSPAMASGQLGLLSVRLDRMQAGVQTGIVVTLAPVAVAGVDSVSITLPSGFIWTSTVSVDLAGLDPGVQPLPGSLVASRSGQVVTVYGIGPMTSGTVYGYHLTSAQNPSVGQQLVGVATRAGALTVETSTAAVVVVGSDQVSVVAIRVPNPVCRYADLNCDSRINIFDLSILLSNYGRLHTVADINNDGIVNIFDLSILLSRYGS